MLAKPKLSIQEILGIKTSNEQYKNSQNNVYDRQLKSIWNRRLANIVGDLDTWTNLLRVRQIIVKKEDAKPIYLAFTLKCMRSGKQYLAKSTLEQLLQCVPENKLQFVTSKHSPLVWASTSDIEKAIPQIPSQHYEVIYTYCQYLYQDGKDVDKVAAMLHLLRLASSLQSIQNHNSDLLKQVYITMADWYTEMISPLINEA